MFSDANQLIVHIGLGHGLLHQLLPDQAKVAPLVVKVSPPPPPPFVKSSVALSTTQCAEGTKMVSGPSSLRVKPLAALTESSEDTAYPPASIATTMACFKCDFKAPLSASLRYAMYSHYVEHYRTELQPYMRQDLRCVLCGKKGNTKLALEQHVALRHRLLDKLLPKAQRIPAESAGRTPFDPGVVIFQGTCEHRYFTPKSR
jgi:hypothetical protein